jgi:hypothetical protein
VIKLCFDPRSRRLLESKKRRFTAGLSMLLLLTVVGGCNRGLPTEYGKSKGRSGLQSINGFGTLRRSFESNGWKTQDIRRLSARLQSVDAIVWTPTTHLPTAADESEAIHWLQQWLDERPRTLIYVIPDDGSELDYWRLAKGLAPPAQRLEYRRRYARTLTTWMTEPQDQPSLDRIWFKAKRRKQDSPSWEILHPVSAVDSAATPVTPPTVSSTARVRTGRSGVVISPSGSSELESIDPERFQYEPLISDDAEATLVMRISWDPAGIDGDGDEGMDGPSQVLVVAGGSQVNNFALTQPQGRQVAQTLLDHSELSRGSGAGRAAFLLSNYTGVPVSEGSDEPPISSGMELLTVWPLSLVTMHLALMGIIACLILLPIFGRPRHVKERPTSDFADHIHAVAVLMNRSGGEEFARARISDYFRRLRGETAGKWIAPEQRSEPLAHSRPHAHSKRIAQDRQLPPQPVDPPEATLGNTSEPINREPQT